jgi:ATP-dependent DNA helicase RecQ
MNDEDRKTNQDLFITEKVQTIVATIAFGMGIDKSNVRYVIHTGLPKSLEHYQQESGRAGRDGLEAECVLFHSGGDYDVWKSLMKDMPDDAKAISLAKLDKILAYCTTSTCRHKEILRYFGQDLENDNCQGCDICLGELECLEDSLTAAQKILSCIVRQGERFGIDYTGSVLTGSRDKRILQNRHDALSTYGLLKEHSQSMVRSWIEHLAGQGYISKVGEFNVLQVTEKGWEILRGKGTPRLFKPKRQQGQVSAAAVDSWDGVDNGLFQALRELRASIAQKKSVPAFVVFSDAALRDMARRRPSNQDAMLTVQGVGRIKCQQYGQPMLDVVISYCRRNSLQMDIPANPRPPQLYSNTPKKDSAVKSRQAAFDLFKRGLSVKEVAASIGRAESTTTQYLVEHIERQKISDPQPWVDAKTYGRVIAASQQVGDDRLKPIHEHLAGQVDYDRIRISLACYRHNT